MSERPSEVRTALFLLWLSYATTAAGVIVLELVEPTDPVIWWIIVPMYAVWAAVLRAISKRQNWARFVALLVVVASLLAYIAWPEVRPEVWSEEIPTYTSLAIDCVAVYLLFTTSGTRWFRSRPTTNSKS